MDKGIATPIPLARGRRHHLCKDPPRNARKQSVISTVWWQSVKVQIEFDFESFEFLVGFEEFLKHPHKSQHCMLVIT
jgi:hypothetical protein